MIYVAAMRAVAARLVSRWPERKVRVDEVPSGAEGHFFVNIVEPDMDKGLDRQRRHQCTITVIYTEKEHSKEAYLGWVEEMFALFEELEVLGRAVHPLNPHAEQQGREYQFLFDLQMRGLRERPPEEKIEEMLLEGKDDP